MHALRALTTRYPVLFAAICAVGILCVIGLLVMTWSGDPDLSISADEAAYTTVVAPTSTTVVDSQRGEELAGVTRRDDADQLAVNDMAVSLMSESAPPAGPTSTPRLIAGPPTATASPTRHSFFVRPPNQEMVLVASNSDDDADQIADELQTASNRPARIAPTLTAPQTAEDADADRRTGNGPAPSPQPTASPIPTSTPVPPSAPPPPTQTPRPPPPSSTVTIPPTATVTPPQVPSATATSTRVPSPTSTANTAPQSTVTIAPTGTSQQAATSTASASSGRTPTASGEPTSSATRVPSSTAEVQATETPESTSTAVETVED